MVMIESPQGRLWPETFDPKATETDILYCFRLLLGRFPAKHEWLGHALQKGCDLQAVVRTYLSSLEFANRGLIVPPKSSHQWKAMDGFSMYASPEDLAVGRVILAKGIYEPAVTRAFRTRLRPGMTVVDVGANIGYFSLLSASLVGSTGSVIAVEPNPRNVKALYASAARNGFRHVHVFQAAASDECGLLFLNVDSSNGTVSPAKGDIDDMLSRETVPALTLDTIIEPSRRVDLIKLDTEGAEYKVLRGARKFLSASRPTIISEFSPGQLQCISAVTPEKYLELFVDLGYQISILGESAELPCGTDTKAVLDKAHRSGTDHIDIVAEPLECASQRQ